MERQSVKDVTPVPRAPLAKKEATAGIEWMSVSQIRQLLNEIRELSSTDNLKINTILSNQMTVEQFCTIFALGQHKKRFQKK
jgi:hypothetical protein